MRSKNLLPFFGLFGLLLGSLAWGQVVTGPTQDTASIGAYNSVTPTCTSGQLCRMQVDASGNLKTTTGTSPSASSGIAPGVAGSGVSGLVLKASPGNLYSIYVTPTVAGYLMIFNATAVPSNGATTAGVASGNMQDCISVPANQTSSVSYNPGPPEVFSVGISAAFSSTACSSLTLSTSAFIHGSVQ